MNVLNKFSGAIFDERLASTKLAANNDLNTVEQRSIKNKTITNI